MTVPDAPPPPSSSSSVVAPAAQDGVRALSGNRAALTVLVLQQLVTAFLAGLEVPIGGRLVHVGLSLPLGWALILSVFVNVGVMALLFRPTAGALLRDSRWRTPPDWGTALAAFVLAFLASRAFVLAYVLLFPASAEVIPQFLAPGASVWVLLLGAGLLVPFMEEVAFRGLMMRGHERAAGFTVAALATSAAFALAHGVPATIAGILPLAYVLARAVQHTGSLWTGVLIHVLNNVIAVALGALLSGGLDQNSPLSDPGALVGQAAQRWPVALGAALFGALVLWITHLWLTPRPDPQERRSPGPWLSASYVVIVAFGLLLALSTLPAVRGAVSNLGPILR